MLRAHSGVQLTSLILTLNDVSITPSSGKPGAERVARGVARRAEREAGGRTEDRPPHVRGGAQSRALGSTGEITPVGIPTRGPGLFLGRNLSARTGFLPDPWAGESEEMALVFTGFLPCVSGCDVASWPATGCAWKSPHSDSGLCPPCDAEEAW